MELRSVEAIVVTLKFSTLTLLRMEQESGREKDLLDVIALRKLDPYR